MFQRGQREHEVVQERLRVEFFFPEYLLRDIDKRKTPESPRASGRRRVRLREKVMKVLSVLAMVCALAVPAWVQQEVHLDVHGVQAVATDCTDGTQVFAVTRDGGRTGLYVFKGGHLIFSGDGLPGDEGSGGLSLATSIMCLKHGIVIHGASPVYSVASALVVEDGRIAFKQVGVGQGQFEVTGNEKATVIRSYKDDSHEDANVAMHTEVLETAFRIPEGNEKMPLTVTPQYMSGDRKNGSLLTALSDCYADSLGASYTVTAYTTDKKAGQVEIRDGENSASTYFLPFVAGNSMCIAGDTYLFGKSKGRLRVAKLQYNSSIEQFVLERIAPEKAPLLPSLRDAGPGVFTPAEYSAARNGRDCW